MGAGDSLSAPHLSGRHPVCWLDGEADGPQAHVLPGAACIHPSLRGHTQTGSGLGAGNACGKNRKRLLGKVGDGVWGALWPAACEEGQRGGLERRPSARGTL